MFKKYLWLVALAFLIGFLFTIFALAKSVGAFFILILVLGVFMLIDYGTSKNFGLTLLSFFIVLFLFLLGMRAAQKVTTVFAKDEGPRQVDTIIIDGQLVTNLTVIPATEDQQASNPMPVFEPGNCVSSNFNESIRQWCSFIETSAQTHNVDPKLIAAIMLMESGGDPHAGKTITNVDGVDYHCSRDGAIGLMQIMPRDGLSGAKYGSMFASRPSVAELYNDPAFNIEYGTAMMAGLLNKYGNMRDALLHYGPSGCGYECYADPIINTYNTY